MDEENKVVENEVVDATDDQTSDWETKYQALQAEKEKIEAEKENYRKGLLKAKGYLPNDYADTSDTTPAIEEVVKKVIAESLIDEKSRTSKEEERKLVENLIQENKKLKELTVSLQNRSQINSSASSSSGSKAQPGDKKHGWTDEQEKNLRSKGIDPTKAWENFQKIKKG